MEASNPDAKNTATNCRIDNWQKTEDDAVNTLLRLREAAKFFNRKGLIKSLQRTTM